VHILAYGCLSYSKPSGSFSLGEAMFLNQIFRD